MQIVLFTDFGSADLYVGQVHAVLAAEAPDIGIVDLLHDAPRFDARAGAHLLAALTPQLRTPSVVLAVVDPGVGGARDAVAVRCGAHWLVGPDNGLLSVAVARTSQAAAYTITWRPGLLSPTFHGRDLFAPVAARLARGDDPASLLAPRERLSVQFSDGDLAEVIYVDHYGNAITGLRAGDGLHDARLQAGGRNLARARTFSDVPAGSAFWYVGSLGLVEIAVNGGSAADVLGLGIGDAVSVLT
ncbi:MAG TPA: SAM-dependent chlorinase/fluorinase [Pelomicrobium sp.]|nr:SAM-dependent chlorinase/fluorinase [Pelomicrobium sp.]